MIKIKRKDTDKARQAVVDLEKAKQSGSTYNTENVKFVNISRRHRIRLNI